MPSVLEDLLHGKHAPDPALATQLQPDEIADLIAIADGTRPSEHPTRAIDVLAAVGSAEAVQVLSRVLIKRRDAEVARRAAAAQLGRLGGKAAEAALIRAASETTDVALHAIIARALVRCGTDGALPVLERMARRKQTELQLQAHFAAMVIECRDGRFRLTELWDEPRPLPLDRRSAAPIRIEHADPTLARAAENWMAHDRFGLELDFRHALSAICGRERYVAFFSRAIVDEPQARLRDRSHLAGIVLQQSPEDNSFSVRWLVLTAPKDGHQIGCALFRLDGRQVMRGVIVEGKLELVAVDGRGAVPTQISANIGRQMFHVGAARTGIRSRMTNAPAAAPLLPRP